MHKQFTDDDGDLFYIAWYVRQNINDDFGNILIFIMYSNHRCLDGNILLYHGTH